MTPPPAPIPGARLLFSLDPAIAYLNHGAFGAVPLAVQRAQQRLRDEMESNPHKF
ncbi:MAG TPA: aminotransferase, partial [Micromonosporaceae bacterium]